MNRPYPIRTRLVDCVDEVSPADAKTKRLFAGMDDLAPFEASEAAAIRERLERTPANDDAKVGAAAIASLSAPSRRRPTFVSRSLLIAAALTITVAAAGAVAVQQVMRRGDGKGLFHFGSDHDSHPESPAPNRAAPPPPRANPTAIELPAPAEPPPPEDAVVEKPLAAKPSLAPHESALSEESRVLGEALRKLRQDRDARGALVALDAYAARYPHGLLKEEAELARIDALLLAGRRPEALKILDAKFLDAIPQGVELRIARGELRLDAGRIDEALRDFEAAMPSATGALAERGLYGRGLSRAKSGDEAGARTDFESYLSRYPNGRFATRARESLRGDP